MDTVGEEVGSVGHQGNQARLESRVEVDIGPLEPQGSRQSNNGANHQRHEEDKEESRHSVQNVAQMKDFAAILFQRPK